MTCIKSSRQHSAISHVNVSTRNQLKCGKRCNKTQFMKIEILTFNEVNAVVRGRYSLRGAIPVDVSSEAVIF